MYVSKDKSQEKTFALLEDRLTLVLVLGPYRRISKL